LATGEILFDSELVMMKVDVSHGEKVWKKALKLLEGECPVKHEDCVWCVNIEV